MYLKIKNVLVDPITQTPDNSLVFVIIQYCLFSDSEKAAKLSKAHIKDFILLKSLSGSNSTARRWIGFNSRDSY
jgi:hypothetical protein